MALGKRPGFDPNRTWTVALVGHRSAGKTSLAEHLLATAGAVRKAGRVEQGTALLDFEPDERREKRSRRNAFAWLPWRGDHRIQLIDVPGMRDARGDQIAALQAVDAMVLVVDASAGLEAGAEKALAAARAHELPVLVALTKIERIGDIDGAVQRIASQLEGAIALQQPLFDHEGALCGVVDVVRGKALRYADDGTGAWSPEPLSVSAGEYRAVARELMCDAVAATDDALLETYLEWFELTDDQLVQGLARATARRRAVPVLLTSAARGIGGSALLDAICDLLPPAGALCTSAMDDDGALIDVPADGPFLARLVSRHLDADGQPYAVFRVCSGSIPRSGSWKRAEGGESFKARKVYQLRGPRRAVFQAPGAGALVAVWQDVPGVPGEAWGDGRLRLERTEPPEPLLRWTVEPVRSDDGARKRICDATSLAGRLDGALDVNVDVWPPRIGGLSESHLRRTVDWLKAATGLELRIRAAPVRYLETPMSTVSGIEGLHVREGDMGLVEEFGACVVDVGPLPDSDDIAWDESLAPEDAEELPAKYRPAIRQGVLEGLKRGPSGYPVVGASVRLVGGRYDILSSTEDHFVQAGQAAIQRALERSGTAILEPWSSLLVLSPEATVGDVITLVSGCRGRIVGMEGATDGRTGLRALVPERELQRLGEQLGSATHGRGSMTRKHSHYEPLPGHLAPERGRPPNGPGGTASKASRGRGHGAC